MDLRTTFPRSMRVRLEGYVHLARMIDKCRAVLAGTEGEYIYPCPMDDRLMAFAGITAAQFTAAVKQHLSDEGVIQWFRGMATPHPQAELEEWNRMMSVPYTHLRAHETVLDLVCRLLLEKKKKTEFTYQTYNQH